MTGRPDAPRARGRQAKANAESLGHLPLQVMANLQLGAARMWKGEFRQCEDCVLRLLRLLDFSTGVQQFSLVGAAAEAARA